MVQLIHNEQLINHIYEYDIILIGTSIVNTLGNGFQAQVKLNFPEVNLVNKSTPYGDLKKLGTICQVKSRPKFILMYITRGRRRPDLNPVFLDYEALEKCLSQVSESCKGKKVASTLIGSTIYDGAGDSERILGLFKQYFNDVDLDIYDVEQEDVFKQRKIKWHYVMDALGTPEFASRKKDFWWEDKMGIYMSKPEGYDEMTIPALKKLLTPEYILNRHKERLASIYTLKEFNDA